MENEVSYSELLDELQKLSGGKGFENIQGARTIMEWQTFWGVSDKPARDMLTRLKEAGCIKVVKKQIERLDGRPHTCSAFVIELKTEVKTEGNKTPPTRKTRR